MRTNNIGGDEKGQVLILFALMMSVLLIFVVMVVDVGFFLEKRRDAQNVVDAAALAGSQELPGWDSKYATQHDSAATDPVDMVLPKV